MRSREQGSRIKNFLAAAAVPAALLVPAVPIVGGLLDATIVSPLQTNHALVQLDNDFTTGKIGEDAYFEKTDAILATQIARADTDLKVIGVGAGIVVAEVAGIVTGSLVRRRKYKYPQRRGRSR